MKRSRLTQRSTIVMVAVGMLVLVTVWSVVPRGDQPEPERNTAEQQVVALDLDYKTYSSAAELRADADLIVLGAPEGPGQTIVGPSLGVSPDGKEAPGIPMTEFRVKIKKALKGTIPESGVITVVLTGGETAGTKYVVEDFPWLTKGKFAVMYLDAGEDGKFYPLAGGAALAAEKPHEKDNYTLPKAVTDQQEINLSESEL